MEYKWATALFLLSAFWFIGYRMGQDEAMGRAEEISVKIDVLDKTAMMRLSNELKNCEDVKKVYRYPVGSNPTADNMEEWVPLDDSHGRWVTFSIAEAAKAGKFAGVHEVGKGK